jgi:uncharacterized membrane protein YhhN
MLQLLQAVFVVCCLGFGWAAGSARLFHDREHGCATVLAATALLVAGGGLVWAIASQSPQWTTWAAAMGAVFLGGLAGALKRRY